MGIAFGALCLRVGRRSRACEPARQRDGFPHAFGFVAAVALAALFDVRKLAPNAGRR